MTFAPLPRDLRRPLVAGVLLAAIFASGLVPSLEPTPVQASTASTMDAQIIGWINPGPGEARAGAAPLVRGARKSRHIPRWRDGLDRGAQPHDRRVPLVRAQLSRHPVVQLRRGHRLDELSVGQPDRADVLLQTHTAGLKNFDLEYRVDYGTWSVIRSGTTSTSLSLGSRPHGHYYSLRVRSRDWRGNVSYWTTSIRVWVP